MNTMEALRQRRSIRKFRPEPIPTADLLEILDTARLYPSGGNLQPLRFALITAPVLRDAIFADLKWAMYLPDYSIAPQERPTAYIILLRDEAVSKNCGYDLGAASTMLMIGAVEKGLASCPIGNFSRAKVSALLQLPENLVPELVLSLGYPAQESAPVPMADTICYSRDSQGNFLVPKHSLGDILVFHDREEVK